jgi:hypothetical protein
MSTTLKTSEAWHTQLNPKTVIMDPDGWDRRNFETSFYQEKISKEEYQTRLSKSTTSVYIHGYFDGNANFKTA